MTGTKRTPSNRTKLWTGTVHFATVTGRPACGSGKRTHSDWMHPTTEPVTCAKCEARFGADDG